jgi:hypothetical protein
MSAIDEIVAWVRERADADAVAPPASPEVLADLAARGAPADVLAIYRALGDNIKGLLSPVRNQRWLYSADAVHADPRGGWVLGFDRYDWLVVVDGALVRRPRWESNEPRSHAAAEVRVADSIEALLAGRLAQIRSGELAWDPDEEALVGVDEIDDRTLLSGVVAQSTGRSDAFATWTRAVVDALCAVPGDEYQVDVAGVGVIRVTEADIVNFEAAPWLAWRVMPDGPEPARTEVVAIPQLSEDQGRALAIAVTDTLGAALAEGRVVRWPGLGVFWRFRVVPLSPRRPERFFPDFRLFPAAQRPFLRAVVERRASLEPHAGRDRKR